MAYSEQLADRIRQRLAHLPRVEEKKMMGGLVFMVDEKMCVGVSRDKDTGEDRLMARVGEAACEAYLGKRGFLPIYPEGIDRERDSNY